MLNVHQVSLQQHRLVLVHQIQHIIELIQSSLLSILTIQINQENDLIHPVQPMKNPINVIVQQPIKHVQS